MLGRGTQYPVVTTLSAGSTVTIHGCLSGWSWCDTSWRGARGWVSGSYLESIYEGRRVVVPRYGTAIGLPIISFGFGYWDNHYRDRPWYRDRDRWWNDRDWDRRDRREDRQDVREERRELQGERREFQRQRERIRDRIEDADSPQRRERLRERLGDERRELRQEQREFRRERQDILCPGPRCPR